MRRVLPLLCLAVLAFPAIAQASEQTLVLRSPAIAVEPFGVAQGAIGIDSPRVDGYVVGMKTDVVDAQGRIVPNTDVMLHHAVFTKVLYPDYTCSAFTGYDGRQVPFPLERFYAAGEERMQMRLPQGFGYPNKGSDIWGLVYMLMNHHAHATTVYVQYTVRYVTGEALRDVRPVWLDVMNCLADPIFNVPGTGGKGSTISRKAEFRMPESGVIVSGMAHLHGGGVHIDLRNARCPAGIFRFYPTWGGQQPRPIMHEPSPTQMGSFVNAAGVPVRAGDTLRIDAVYENDRPHVRVMGIAILYFAAGTADDSCLHMDAVRPGGPAAERLTIQLLKQPAGRLYTGLRETSVREYRYGAERIQLQRGARFTWRFVGTVPHDVTLASGPVGFASPSLSRGSFTHRFTRSGVYRLFCSLHPSRMTQTVTVRSSLPSGRR